MTKAALITGGAQRIGRTIAEHLAAAGYDIALHYRRSEADANAIAEAVAGRGVTCRTYRADLADPTAAAALSLIDAVMADFPALSVVVNNASVYPAAMLRQTTPALLDENFALHFRSPFFIMQRFVAGTDGGLIVNMLDTKIRQDGSTHAAYLLSKKSLADLTRMAALEFAPTHRVCGICPGPILPPPGQDAGYLAARGKSVPLQRTGAPAQILSALDYLIHNPFVTGELLHVDGGEHLL
jgi:NAD(P)-dependent dehydrogenase (short-subunit alcohol dehydrogenase family)